MLPQKLTIRLNSKQNFFIVEPAKTHKTSWTLKKKFHEIIPSWNRHGDSIEFNLTGGDSGRIRWFYEITLRDYERERANISYPNRNDKTARDAWWKNSRHSSDKVSDTPRAGTNTNERVRNASVALAVGASLSHCQSHQTTVIATGATSNRDSRCRSQHHRLVLSFSLPPFLPPSLSLLFVYLSHSLSLSRSHDLFSHSVLLPPKPGLRMSPSQDSVALLNYSPPRMLPGSN